MDFVEENHRQTKILRGLEGPQNRHFYQLGGVLRAGERLQRG